MPLHSRLLAPRAMPLSITFVGTSLFGGQFKFSAEKAMCSQDQLSQARHLPLLGQRLLKGLRPHRAQKQRAAPPIPPPLGVASLGDGSLAAKCHRFQTGLAGGLAAPSSASGPVRCQGAWISYIQSFLLKTHGLSIWHRT